jgi:uncharacterized protein
VHFIFFIAGVILLFDAIWWIASMRLTRGKSWRWLVSAFLSAEVFGLLWLFGGRLSGADGDRALPKFAVTGVFIWHTLLLPLFVAAILLALPVLVISAGVRFFRRKAVSHSAVTDSERSVFDRRQFLAVAAAATPPVLTVSLSTIAMRQLQQFRVRRFTLPIRDLPTDLHGTTIAQVSDMHVGRFTTGRVLREMVKTVNDLRADLILLTGDLINDALEDLTEGINLVRAMQARFGVYIIEGNHDLIENAGEFERRMRASGIPFLLDQSSVISVRGAPVQLLGLSWTRALHNRDEAIAESVHQLLGQRQDEAFPIFMAHHPHAFDAAAEASMPLTISGHTHGGQLMWNEHSGFGPILFRYWSGLYNRGESKLIVSNGVGNWFPLRINAPAEVVHLTLVRA